MNGHRPKAKDWDAIANDAKFRPGAMAALCSISLRQLERHFVNCFHKTPSEWTRELRLRLSRRRVNKAKFPTTALFDRPQRAIFFGSQRLLNA